MRILNLKMKAFLPYKEEVEINFEEMHQGLYLISGATGSGKTAIFDAIVFALYGHSSGSRSQASLRSDYADEKEETFVELTFEVNHHIYMIRRMPSYPRAHYKTNKPASALLQFEDGRFLDGIKEVNEKVEEIIGISLDQFKQIVMISQGDFTRLIYANSDEREKVLRKVFNTYHLLDLENNLKEKVKEMKNQYENSTHLLNSQLALLTDFSAKTFTPDLLEKIEDNIKQTESEANQLRIQIDSKEKEYDELSKNYQLQLIHNQKVKQYDDFKKQYKKLKKQSKEMDELRDEIKHINHIHDHLDLISQYDYSKKQYHQHLKESQSIKEEQKKINEQYKKEEKNYASLSDLKKDKDELLLEVNTLSKAISSQKEHQEDLKQYEEEKQELAVKQKAYKEAVEKKDKLKNRVERDSQNVDRLADLSEQLQEMDQAVQSVNEKRIQIHELSDLYDRYKEEQDRHFSLVDRYNELANDYRSTYEYYLEEDQKYKQQQVGIIAMELKEGEPCPVCGSIHHPQPARIKGDVMSAKQLEHLSEKLSEMLNERDGAYDIVMQHKETITRLNVQIESLKEKLDIHEDLSKKVFIQQLSNITNIINERKDNYLKLSDEVQYLKRLRKSVRQDKADLNKREASLDEDLNQLNALSNHVALLEGKIENYQDKDEDYQSQYQKVSKRYQQLEKQLDQLEKDHQLLTRQKISIDERNDHYKHLVQEDYKIYKENAEAYHDFISSSFKDEKEFKKYYQMLSLKEEKEKTYQDYIIEVEKVKNSLAMLDKELDSKERVALDDLEKELSVKKKEKDKLQESYHRLTMKISNNQHVYHQLKDEYKHNEEVLTQYQNYLHLSDMTCGKNPLKLSFERYVLSFYFENILDYANIELSTLSQGRYQFVRKQEVKGNRKQGLDLSILDYETGVIRDVQSLSGGESFKAALSLALGLSSMIQSYVGGIELNTLFIDEGFGTLDEESLNQAIEVLMHLEMNHKTIGIISHVNELKERIDNQIIITKGNEGSQITVHFNQ